MKVLAFVEQRSGKIKSSAFEVLSLAAKLAGSPKDVAAVVIGKGIGGQVGQLAGYGVDTVFTLDGDVFDKYDYSAYVGGIAAAVKEFSPALVVGIASPMGRDIFPRLAVRLDGAIATDVTEVESTGGALRVTKPMYAGKCLATIELKSGAMHFVTIRPNVFPANKTGGGAATGKPLAFTPSASRIKTLEVRKGKSEKPDLTEASVIISGGRAMASADNFKILHECGDVIGATVGASRAAVDSGYASHEMQVGQTGKTVNPNLYIACGISGSIQHMAGMRTSKVIVAVNTDKEAPIMSVANYAIVADLFQVMPIMTKKFKELLG